jgi:hypothetical protein
MGLFLFAAFPVQKLEFPSLLEVEFQALEQYLFDKRVGDIIQIGRASCRERV